MPRRPTVLLAVACGVAVANVCFAQPLLVTIAPEFDLGPSATGLVVTLTQAGYALGLVLLMPLGDLLDRRRLVVAQFLLLAAALTVVATAADGVALLAGVAAVGLLAVVTQALVAFAAALAGPAERGRVVGVVTSGVVAGILLTRTVSGVLADQAGWRSVCFCSALLSPAPALALHRMLPVRTAPPAGLRHGRLLRSTAALVVHEPVFRRRSRLAMLLSAAFSTLWSSIALPLSAAPLSLSHRAIGAFGPAGAAGAPAAAPAGRWHDRGLGGRVTVVRAGAARPCRGCRSRSPASPCGRRRSVRSCSTWRSRPSMSPA